MARLPTYAELDARREGLRTRLSRAELCRRAGISESTFAKGLRQQRTPTRAICRQIELVLEAAGMMQEAGL